MLDTATKPEFGGRYIGRDSGGDWANVEWLISGIFRFCWLDFRPNPLAPIVLVPR